MYIKHREVEPRLPLGRDGGSTGGHTGLPKPPVSLRVESWFPEWANGLPKYPIAPYPTRMETGLACVILILITGPRVSGT